MRRSLIEGNANAEPSCGEVENFLGINELEVAREKLRRSEQVEDFS
jgi:hypothetical protein